MIPSKIETKNGKFAVYFSEPKGLPQLFCIHGGMGLCSDSLIPGLMPLSELFDLVFIDQRGCGKSDAARDGSYQFSNFAEDIAEVVLQTKTGENIGIFGHSMGGMIAIETLAQFPDLFQFAILSNTALDDSWRVDGAKAVEQFKTKAMSSAIHRYGEKPEDDERLRSLAVMYGPLYFRELSEEKARLQMTEFTYRGDAIEFMNKHTFSGMNLTKQASAIRAPTLLISGGMDVIVPPRCLRAIADVISNSTHSTIESVGHFPFITKADKFFEQISQWWEKMGRKA